MADDNRCTPCSSSSLIPVGGKNFASMQSAAEVTALQDTAPAFHRQIMNALRAAGTVRGAYQPEERETATVHKERKMGFGNGAIVKDKEGRRLTIIHASAGHTKKTRTPVHRVADRKGNSWLEKQSNLTLVL